MEAIKQSNVKQTAFGINNQSYWEEMQQRAVENGDFAGTFKAIDGLTQTMRAGGGGSGL